MVRTGAYAYVNYGWESTFGGTASAMTKSFGLKTAITGMTLGTNRQSLYKLGQVEPEKYFYGQQTGTLGLDFVLGDVTSGEVFRAIYGYSDQANQDMAAGTAGDPHIFGSDTGSGSTKSFANQSFSTELGFAGETETMVRTFKGCILNGLGITATVGDVVKCTGDVVFGKEDNPSSSGHSDDATEASQPFTFAHGTFTLNNGVQTQIQDVDINFAQNGELLYALGTNQSVAGIKKTLDITGRFKVAWKDNQGIEATVAQLVGTNYKETWGDKYSGAPEFELIFAKLGVVSGGSNDGDPVVASGQKFIKITGKGLGITDHNISGLEPIEAVFEELNWAIKSAKITVVNA